MNARRDSGFVAEPCGGGEADLRDDVAPVRSPRASLAALFLLLLVASPTAVIAQALAQPGTQSAATESGTAIDVADVVASRRWAIRAGATNRDSERGTAQRPCDRPRRLLPMGGLPAPRAP